MRAADSSTASVGTTLVIRLQQRDYRTYLEPMQGVPARYLKLVFAFHIIEENLRPVRLRYLHPVRAYLLDSTSAFSPTWMNETSHQH